MWETNPRVVLVQGHRHSEPVCAWPDCQTYLTAEQMDQTPQACHTPECTSPATTERRVGHVRSEEGDTWEARWVPMCRGCASEHDMEVQIKGWAPMTTTTKRSTT